MIDVPQNVLDRIRKCLALAASANPGEAETAMQHARKLMEKYGLERTDIELSEIGEIGLDVKSHLSSNWMFRLFNLVQRLLGVTTYIRTCGRSTQNGRVNFIGPKAKLELAQYLCTVLLRQIQRDRQAYLKTLRDDMTLWSKTWFYSRSEKSTLADVFCTQWLAAVEGRLKALFTETPAIVQTYVEKAHPELSPVTGRRRSNYVDENVRYDAAARGQTCGENADVFLAMGKHPDAEGLGLDQRKLTHG